MISPFQGCDWLCVLTPAASGADDKPPFQGSVVRNGGPEAEEDFAISGL
ncbi:hypothetical protein [uncultured Chryseobacterium sp.]|nr:hypothetical protein [uncultured Chryseobacterium sp.]